MLNQGLMNAKIIAGVSITLNVALLAFLLARPGATEITKEAGQTETPRAVTDAMGAPPGDLVAIPAGSASFDWRMVESEDYKAYIANLRAIGCPEETIQDIIRADVKKLFESREKAGPKKEFKFWETGMKSFASLMDPEDIARRQEVAQERRALLKELLGEDFVEPPQPMFNEAAMVEALLDFLPPEKQNRVIELQQKYAAELMKSMGSSPDMEEMQAVLKEQHAELASFLTPAELEQYQLTLSPLSMIMRMELDGFDPTEDEFREIFRIRFEHEGNTMGFPGTESAETRAKVENDLQALLGQERWTEYKRASDHEFKAIDSVATKHDLGRPTAVQVYDIKGIAQAEARQVRANTQLSPDERAQALNAIRAETESAVKTVLGEAAFNDYQKRGGHWINGLAR
jgi:hypothetical protein